MANDAKRLLGYALVVLIFVGAIASAVVSGRAAQEIEPPRESISSRVVRDRASLSEMIGFAGVLDVPRKSPGTMWDAPGNVVFKNAVLVSLGDATKTANEMELSLDMNDVYVVHWLHRGKEVGKAVKVGPTDVPGGGLAIYRVSTGAESIDAVVVMAVSGDGMYSVGHVIPIHP
jgi:hypothetical protein